jgi:muramoyltetrapeptide carboxypeptidase
VPAASGADVALISRGGYGLTRILPRINYKAVARAVERGTRFVGLSDFTAFQNAVLAKTGAVTWAGPALGEDFGVEGTPDDIMEACFDDLIVRAGRGHGLATAAQHACPATQGGGCRPNKGAVLWGGNLAVLGSLVGTPWLPQPGRGAVSWKTCTSTPTASSAC